MNTYTRPPPPQGRLGFLGRTDLRFVVMMTTFMTAIWSISSAIGFYRNIGPYNDNGAPKLATISIIVGSLYMGVFAIGVYGFAAAFTRKLLLVRIFAYLSAFAVLLVAGINLFRVVIHFTMKKTILDACANVTTGDTFFYGGWWGPMYSDTLTPGEARNFCNHYYDRDSWSMILGLIFLTVVGTFFSVIAFAFLRQTLDPMATGNVIHRQNPSVLQHYAPPYSTGYGSYPPPYPHGNGDGDWEDPNKGYEESGPKAGVPHYG